VEWVVREGVGAGGRNEPSLVCTYELKKKCLKKKKSKILNSNIILMLNMDWLMQCISDLFILCGAEDQIQGLIQFCLLIFN
jgi:hypothetical protein